MIVLKVLDIKSYDYEKYILEIILFLSGHTYTLHVSPETNIDVIHNNPFLPFKRLVDKNIFLNILHDIKQKYEGEK